MVTKPDQGPRRCRPWAVCYEYLRLGRMGDGAVWGCYGVGAGGRIRIIITIYYCSRHVEGRSCRGDQDLRGRKSEDGTSDMAESESEGEGEGESVR